MTVEPSYQAGIFLEGIGPPELEELIDRGVLVPDSRLQAIADAINENTETLYRLNTSPTVGGGQCVLCGGSVEAVDAVPLDALTEENNDCEHEWVDTRNEVISSGEWCPKCNAIRAGNTEEDKT